MSLLLTTLIDGNRETRTLADGTYFVGRNAGCQIRFPLPDVSERHAVLTVREGIARIEDLHSANGTLVNGEPIEQAETLDGSKVVQLGSGMLRVSEEETENSDRETDQRTVNSEQRTDRVAEASCSG